MLVTTADRPQVIRMAKAYGCEIVLIESTGMGDSIAAGVAACAQLEWLVDGAGGYAVYPAFEYRAGGGGDCR